MAGGGADAGAAGAGQPGAAGGAQAGGADGGADAGSGDAAARPAGVAVESVLTELGGLSNKIEEKLTEGFQATALAEVREEFPKYFEAIETHPYRLTGAEVPAIGREGTIRLNSTEEAREWQDAVKHELAAEVRDRASRQLDEQRGTLNTIHASVELFQKNTDLVPGTATFDTELANRFAKMAQPYELRVDGKLNGYSIPVQPIIDSLRAQLQSERTAAPVPPAGAPAAPASTPGQQAPAAAASTPGDQPQAGIPSKAGNSGEQAEDFSTLFGTIGLPNLTI